MEKRNHRVRGLGARLNAAAVPDLTSFSQRALSPCFAMKRLRTGEFVFLRRVERLARRFWPILGGLPHYRDRRRYLVFAASLTQAFPVRLAEFMSRFSERAIERRGHATGGSRSLPRSDGALIFFASMFCPHSGSNFKAPQPLSRTPISAGSVDRRRAAWRFSTRVRSTISQTNLRSVFDNALFQFQAHRPARKGFSCSSTRNLCGALPAVLR